MKKDMLIDIMSNIDDSLIERYTEEKEKLLEAKKRKKKRMRYTTVIGVAASLILVFTIIPWYIRISEGANARSTHIDVQYESISDAEKDLNYKTLFTDLELENATIYVSYNGKDGIADYSNPDILLININMGEGKNAELVKMQISFDISSLDGYKKQYETRKIYGYEVKIREYQSNNGYHIKAAFIHDGFLYEIYIFNSNPDKPVSEIFDSYIEKLLSKEQK